MQSTQFGANILKRCLICERGFVTRWRVSGNARGDSLHSFYLPQVYTLSYDSIGTSTHTHIHTFTHTYNGMCMNAINRRHSFVSRVWSSARIASRSRSVTNASAHSDAHEVPIALVFYKVPRCFVYVIFFSGFRCAGSVGSRLFAEWVPDTAERSVDLGDF